MKLAHKQTEAVLLMLQFAGTGYANDQNPPYLHANGLYSSGRNELFMTRLCS